MRKEKGLIALTIFVLMVLILACCTVDRLDRKKKLTQIDSMEAVIEQGQRVEIPLHQTNRGKTSILSNNKVTVSSNVTKKPLPKITFESTTQAPKKPEIGPKQAIIRREVDKKGNTTLTIETPVIPFKQATNNVSEEGISENTNTLESTSQAVLDQIITSDGNTISEDWFIVNTQIEIPKQRNRVKPILSYSADGELEVGAAMEVFRLEDKPRWIPGFVFDALQWTSLDLVLSRERGGIGVSYEVYANNLFTIDTGLGQTIEWKTKGFEPIMYLSTHF